MSIVQSPDDALYPGMPMAAIEATRPDFVVPAGEMAELVRRLVVGGSPLPVAPATPPSNSVPLASDAVEIDAETVRGSPSPFACPECHGVLWALPERGDALPLQGRGTTTPRTRSSTRKRSIWRARSGPR